MATEPSTSLPSPMGDYSHHVAHEQSMRISIKGIFPGGYSPALSEVLHAIEDSGLWVNDIEVLRLHYAKTLNARQRRFQANRDKIAKLFDERFCRMWDFYLALSESAFLYGDHFVFQMQISRRRNAVPLTRDYQTDWERAHSAEVMANTPKQAA